MLRLPRADEAERHVLDGTERPAAPDLLNAEVLQALRRFERTRMIDATLVAEGVASLEQLRIVRYPTSSLVERVWSLRENFTAYDATYVALAEAIGTRLVTTDERLARAAASHTNVDVVLIS